MKDNFIPTIKCPYCGYRMDCSTGVMEAEGKTPKPGDISICLNCTKVLVFTEGLGMRKPTEEEALVYSTDPRVMTVQIIRNVIPEDLRK